jgi:hypothetical protein
MQGREAKMRFNEFQSLQSEISMLQQLLAEIPEDDVIDRGGIEARLQEIRRELPDLDQVESRDRAKAVLTFRGRPVVGSHGIVAEFGAKATNLFADAVAAIAASLDAPLAASGPIRDRAENQLLITGTAVGSFGFELEAAAPTQLLQDQRTNVELALDRAITVFNACASEDNEQLADNIADLDPRALGKIRDFVSTLAESGATCALTFETNQFRFTDLPQVARSVERLSASNIVSEQLRWKGAFTGAIPSKRTFEFHPESLGHPIVGKVGHEIEDPGIINQILHTDVIAELTATRVGSGPARYVLDGFAPLSNGTVILSIE